MIFIKFNSYSSLALRFVIKCSSNFEKRRKARLVKKMNIAMPSAIGIKSHAVSLRYFDNMKTIKNTARNSRPKIQTTKNTLLRAFSFHNSVNLFTSFERFVISPTKNGEAIVSVTSVFITIINFSLKKVEILGRYFAKNGFSHFTQKTIEAKLSTAIIIVRNSTPIIILLFSGEIRSCLPPSWYESSICNIFLGSLLYNLL